MYLIVNSDPPLDPADIPQGEWICHACKNNSRKDIVGKNKKRKSALEILAFAASLVNPREFDLPRELQLPITFPGTDKTDLTHNKRRKQQGCSNNNIVGKDKQSFRVYHETILYSLYFNGMGNYKKFFVCFIL